jgi:hypothetical protein
MANVKTKQISRHIGSPLVAQRLVTSATVIRATFSGKQANPWRGEPHKGFSMNYTRWITLESFTSLDSGNSAAEKRYRTESVGSLD